MGHHDALLTQLHEAGDPALVLASQPAATLRRLARSYGLFETVGGRYYAGPENVARLALAERLRRARLPHRQHAGSPAPITPELTAAFRTEALRQAALVEAAAPGELLPALAALELLVTVAPQAGLDVLGDAQLLVEVRGVLASPRREPVTGEASRIAGRVRELAG